MRFGLVRNLFATRDPLRVTALENAVEQLWPGRVTVVLSDSYAALTQQFSHGEVEVAWLAPALIIEAARRRVLARIVATVRQDLPDYAAALMVREQSPLRALADLRGTRVGWVDPWSTSGYLFPRRLLRAAGFDPATLFSEQRFYGTHEAVAHALALGEIDVGALYCLLDGSTAPRAAEALVGAPWTSETPLRALAVTGAIPGDALCIATRVPEAEADELCARLARPEAAELARLLDGERFAPRTIDEYGVVRDALEEEWGRTSSSPPEPPR